MPKVESVVQKKETRVARVGDFLQGVNEKLPVHEIATMFAEELKTAPVGSKARTDMLETLMRTMNIHEKSHPEVSDEEIALLSDEQLTRMLKERLGVV